MAVIRFMAKNMNAGSKYYRSKLDTEQLRRLHQRSDVAAVLRVLGHLGALVATGCLFFLFTEQGCWIASAFLLLLHGTIFSFLSYSGASHEFAHHTVFKKKGPNIFFFRFFSFLIWGNHAYFFRTHTIHHCSTLDPEVDTEVPTSKCIAFFKVFVTSTFDVRRMFRTIRMQWLNARGIIPGRAGTLVLPPENTAGRQKVINAARTILLGHLALGTIFASTGLWQLVLLVDLAAFIGNGLPNLLASAQHCGMKLNTLDYRENSRTVLLNPVLAFFYWNMNYHVEHHMYPGVPCYHLPRLRKLIEADLGPATLGLCGIVRAMRQDSASRSLGDCSINAA
jgi:fatty acid desaturase